MNTLSLPSLVVRFLQHSSLETLADEGVMYLSFKYGKVERVDEERFFCDMNESRWKAIVAKIPQVIEYKIWLSADKRSSIENNWFNITIKKID